MTETNPDNTVEGQTLARGDVEALTAQARPLRLADCDLEEADLSHLALDGWTFERCKCPVFAPSGTFRNPALQRLRLPGSQVLVCFRRRHLLILVPA